VAFSCPCVSRVLSGLACAEEKTNRFVGPFCGFGALAHMVTEQMPWAANQRHGRQLWSWVRCTVATGTELSRADFSHSRVPSACNAGTLSAWSSSGNCISTAMAVEFTSTSSIRAPSVQHPVRDTHPPSSVRRPACRLPVSCGLSPVCSWPVCGLSAPVLIRRPVSYMIVCNTACEHAYLCMRSTLQWRDSEAALQQASSRYPGRAATRSTSMHPCISLLVLLLSVRVICLHVRCELLPSGLCVLTMLIVSWSSLMACLCMCVLTALRH